MSDFVHLHCHTEYSLLDGAIKLHDLVKQARKFGMPAAAITDHGTMYGASPFYIACRDEGIDPILGCEVYVTKDHRDVSSAFAKTRHHLILLASTDAGYKNLLKLVSTGCVEGFYYKPRVDKALLRKYSEGIIALSACVAGEIPQTLLGTNELIAGGGTFEDAIGLCREYADIYPGRFYLEVQANGLPEQGRLNNALFELAEHTKLPLVATNDCHYLEASDVEAHDILLCIQQQKTESDPHRWRFEARDLYYKSFDEMSAAFSDCPEAISNTMRIYESCKGVKIQTKAPPYHFPVYDVPDGMTLESEFRRMAKEGLEKRIRDYPHPERMDPGEYRSRLEMELDVICKMGFPGYFLIVQDFINWAKRSGIPVGPGRGSAAGSVVSWALRITNLDPIPYSLYFERFLNIERISMPDIDVDFCEDRRLEVLDYVTGKYGKDKVSQIAAFGKMKAKAVVKDVGRAMGVSYNETNRIAKMLGNSLDVTLEKAMSENPEFRTEYQNNPQVKRLVDIAMRLEGLVRHASTHAAGVVVSDVPLVEYLPLFKGKKDELITQFDSKYVEKAGLVKFDFLGLKTMTLIFRALDNIRLQDKDVPDFDNMDFDDPAVYDLLSRGDTDGVFQFESGGMQKYLKMLKPSTFEDIIAMNALYRPGPLGSGMVDEFCKRKHGEVMIQYPLPQLEDCLKDTYGVIVYQEQVMKIAQIVADYTLGGADLLRRAMGKKKADEMAKHRGIFLEGAVKNGVSQEKANEIFDLMEKFAEYGFNKAHSAAYAVISYQTAYLKCYFKVEFMAALITSEIGNQEKILKYISVCRDMGIRVGSPNVQLSMRAFIPSGDDIVYGFGGIKGIGDEAINELIAAREEGGPYKSLYDLCVRVNLRKVTKKVLENLIKSGACDVFGVPRAAMLAVLDTVVARAQKKAKENSSARFSMLSLSPVREERTTGGIGFECPESKLEEWDSSTMLRFEYEAMGFFLTSHPLQPFRHEYGRLGMRTLEDLADAKVRTAVSVGVLVTAVKETMTKKGDKMAIAQVEDLTGHGEVVFFPNTYADVKELLNMENVLLKLDATIDSQDDEQDEIYGEEEGDARSKQVKLLAGSLRQRGRRRGDEHEEPCAVLLQEACMKSAEPVYLDIPKSRLGDMEYLKELLGRHKGPAPLRLNINTAGLGCTLQLGNEWNIASSPDFYQDFQEWLETA
ncbi:MAG: DNA polymerase III subunit alpha [Mailhella sp.]|nr:DNA polymerase III subunit alpha [Mailhella sp.]